MYSPFLVQYQEIPFFSFKVEKIRGPMKVPFVGKGVSFISKMFLKSTCAYISWLYAQKQGF